jgi:adenosine kinase
MRIVATGSIAFDYLMTYPGEFKEMLFAESLDHISVSFLVDDMTRHKGGNAANIAYTLALLKERPLLVAAAGKDFRNYREDLDKIGVDTSSAHSYDDVFTASFFVSTDRQNNQIASFYTGAMSRASELKLDNIVDGQNDMVVISPNDPSAMENYVEYCKSNGVRYVYDPSQQVARSDGEVLARGVEGAYLLIVNQYEFTALSAKTGLSKDQILGKVENVIITLGEHGADFYLPGQMLHVPAVPEDRIVDPTGVGDAFRAGLLKGIAAGWPWEVSGRVGSLAAVYVLEERGTQNHFFTPAEFVKRYRKNFDDQGLLDALAGS